MMIIQTMIKKAKMVPTIQMSKLIFFNYFSDDSNSKSSEYTNSVESSSDKKKTPIKKKESRPVHSANKIIKKKSHLKEAQKSPKEELKKVSKSASSSKVLKTKNSLVSQLLKRWWFALPKWPPENFDPR